LAWNKKTEYIIKSYIMHQKVRMGHNINGHGNSWKYDYKNINYSGRGGRRRRRKRKSQIWDSKIRWQVPRDSDPRMTALVRVISYCKLQSRPLVREIAPHQQTCNCLTVIKIWSWVPGECFIPRENGRLTVGCNNRLRLR
jgi:hypothetical protein